MFILNYTAEYKFRIRNFEEKKKSSTDKMQFQIKTQRQSQKGGQINQRESSILNK